MRAALFIHSATIQTRNRKQKFIYSAATGTPAIGQTVTGGSSAKTAVIDKTSTGYLVLKTVSGTFAPGETITTSTFSATLTSQTDYQNQSGEYEYYWTSAATTSSVRFGGIKGQTGYTAGAKITEVGEVITGLLNVMYPTTVSLTEFSTRLSTTSTGYSGLYDVVSVAPIYNATTLDHYEAIIRMVNM